MTYNVFSGTLNVT